MNAVSLVNINFGYVKKERILDDINISVPKGSIYGFLGANGAGKTTTLRLIMGLLKAQTGSISVFGESTEKSYPKALRKIGSLIESPSLYGHLSAEKNLKIWAKYFAVPSIQIGHVLDSVNLLHAKDKKTADFSTGMKQRLGLAMTLLHDPELLILDEPTNGLDPMGIIELRKIIHNLRDQGKTILLSSHILSEVEKIVSMIGIIKDGKIVFQGPMTELQQLRQSNLDVQLKVSDSARAYDLISASKKEIIDDQRLNVQVEHERELPKLVKQLVLGGLEVYEVNPVSGDLEKMFLSITNRREA